MAGIRVEKPKHEINLSSKWIGEDNQHRILVLLKKMDTSKKYAPRKAKNP